MKNLIFAICIFALGITNAQTINGTKLADIKSSYVEIVGTSNIMGTRVIISLDFGQAVNIWKGKDDVIMDDSGKMMKFNTMIDALNFMTKYGYEFTAAYAVTMGNQNVYHYLLHKKSTE